MSKDQNLTENESSFDVDVVRVPTPFNVKLHKNGDSLTTVTFGPNVSDKIIAQHVEKWGDEHGIESEKQKELIQHIKNMRDNPHLMMSR